MKHFEEDELLLLSGIQHYAFCPRQWALIHIEQSWSENVLTYEGRRMHDKADNPYIAESRGDVLVTRAMPLVNYELGIYGIADVVEFRAVTEGACDQGVSLPQRRGWWRPFPVEYKRGKPKAGDYDEVQLCAQAMCLEEMLGISIVEGALYYGERERRVPVFFAEGLRKRVRELLADMHQVFKQGHTPAAVYESKCSSCSLKDICLPKLNRSMSRDYLLNYIKDENM